MKTPTRALSAVAGALLLFSAGACSSEGPGPVVEEPAAEVVAEDTVEYATEQQVASVIAEYEPEWRQVIDESGECDLTWLDASRDAADIQANLEGLSCMTRIHTMTVTAGTASSKLGELEIPPSMQDLVDETVGYLDKISSSNVEKKCDTGGNAQEPDCEVPMMFFRIGSMQLESKLNAWAPYL